jgi:hypothetical protein
MAIIGDGAVQLLQKFLYQNECAEDMISVLESMLKNPYYLLYHSFELWGNLISADDEDFLNLFSEAYMQLVKTFEEKYRQTRGGYTQQYTDYLQSQVSGNQTQYPVPTATPQTQEQITAIKQFAQGLNSAGFGKQMQRMHSQTRQLMG